MSSTLSSGILNHELRIKIIWGTDLLKQREDFGLEHTFNPKKGSFLQLVHEFCFYLSLSVFTRLHNASKMAISFVE